MSPVASMQTDNNMHLEKSFVIFFFGLTTVEPCCVFRRTYSGNISNRCNTTRHDNGQKQQLNISPSLPYISPFREHYRITLFFTGLQRIGAPGLRAYPHCWAGRTGPAPWWGRSCWRTSWTWRTILREGKQWIREFLKEDQTGIYTWAASDLPQLGHDHQIEHFTEIKSRF